MSWMKTLAAAFLSAVFGLFAAGSVASLAVDWYQISSFEGGSGYFVILMALLGGAVGFVTGLIASRVVAAQPNPGFLKMWLASTAVVAALVAVAGGTARFLADIPPEIDGETLILLVEVRWPRGAPAPTAHKGVGVMHLGRAMGSVIRREEDGPLFTDLAREEDGHWIVPGAVPIFTSRGQRTLRVGFEDDTTANGFTVPLPGHPTSAQRQWSDWMPHARAGQPPLPDSPTYRFRVVKSSEPVREDVVGPFRIGTTASYFWRSAASEPYSVRGTFLVRLGDQPIDGLTRADSVMVVGGSQPALFVLGHRPDDIVVCEFVSVDAGKPKIEPLAPCSSSLEVHRLTSEQAVFVASRDRRKSFGWLDRTTFAEPGVYRAGSLVIDTRTLTGVEVAMPNDPNPLSSVPPLSLSPDGHSFVWFGLDGSEDKPVLGITDIRDGKSYHLPIRREAMRYNTHESFDPDWVDHHFEWRHEGDADVLHERESFAPLPFHGDLSAGVKGGYQSYALRPGGEALRQALISILVDRLGGERQPDASDGYLKVVKVEGHPLQLQVVDMGSYVSLSTYDADPPFMARLAQRVDAELATGKYDAAFVVPHPPQ